MNCEHFEELLFAYAEGDLSAEDKRRVDSHVQSCKDCRTSLVFYMELEKSLLARRHDRPSATPAARRVARAVRPRRSPVLIPALTSWPGLVASALVLFGAAGLVFGNPLPRLFDTVAEANLVGRFNLVMDSWTRALELATGGNEYTLYGLMGGLTAIILLTGSWMVLRHVRD